LTRAQVRSNVAQWIADAGISHLNQVFTAHPKRINFQANSTAGEINRFAAVVFIRGERESRVALGGASSGWKRVDYDTVVQLYCHSVAAYTQDSMDAFDIVVDAVKERLRVGGHRLGLTDGDVIWQAAEPEITVDYGEPMTNDGGATEIWAGIEFTVTQMIQR
jgi:hypothetical protein